MHKDFDETDLVIRATIAFNEDGQPTAVTISNFGSVPNGALRAIAEEAIDRHFGSTEASHHVRVHLSPVDESSDEFRVFETYTLPWLKPMS